MTKKYELNEKDIDTALKFLRLHDPEHATPEMAMALLEHMQAAFHTMSHDDPDMLEKIYEDLKTKKAI
jgi:cytochrome oxidase Cu insertion factor (SCO1/SenC/PrrC family)